MGAWTWLAVGIAAWMAAAFVVGLLVGQMFRAAERPDPWDGEIESVEWNFPPRDERPA